MKKLSLLTLFLFVLMFEVSAQAPWKAQKKQFSALSLSISPFSETLVGLSHKDVLGLIEDPGDRLDMTGFTKASSFTTQMIGATSDIKIGLAKNVRTNLLAELELGLSMQTASELVLDYNYIGDSPTGNEGFTDIGLCYMHNRIGLSVGYKLRGYGDRSSFSIGPNLTAGKTFNDIVIFLGGTNASGEGSVDARSSTITNLRIDMAYSYRVIDNIALSIGARYGYTYFISPYNKNSLGNNYGISLGFEYQFFRNN